MIPGAEQSADGLIDWFKALIDESGLPATLAQANIPEADLPTLAKDAMFQQRLLINNPREVDEGDGAAALRRSLEWLGMSERAAPAPRDGFAIFYSLNTRLGG